MQKEFESCITPAHWLVHNFTLARNFDSLFLLHYLKKKYKIDETLWKNYREIVENF